jgi:hypothetical protein
MSLVQVTDDATRDVGPPGITLTGSNASTPPPPSAFAPPKDPKDDRPLELESEWVEKRASKQADYKPAARPRMIAGVVAAVLLIGGVVAAVMVIMSRGQPSRPHHPDETPTSEMVVIEIHAKPVATIRVGGNRAGTTPLTLHLPKSATAIIVEATVRGRQLSRQVIPDRDQLVDFTPSQR